MRENLHLYIIHTQLKILLTSTCCVRVGACLLLCCAIILCGGNSLSPIYAALLQQERENLCSAVQSTSQEEGTCTFDPCSYLDMWARWAPTSSVLC